MPWFYTDTRGDEPVYRRFESFEEAEAWFERHDPAGVAWEYPDLESYRAAERADAR